MLSVKLKRVWLKSNKKESYVYNFQDDEFKEALKCYTDIAKESSPVLALLPGKIELTMEINNQIERQYILNTIRE